MTTYESMLDADLQWALQEGSMHFSGSNEVHKTLQRFTARLDELGIEYALAGAMAMYFHGYRRFTEYIDILVTANGLARIHSELEGRGYIRPFGKSKNLRDAENRVRIDFLIAGQFPGDGRPGPVAFPDPKCVAELRDGVRAVDLPTLVQLKLASGRESARRKDLGDAQELIKALSLPQDFREKLDPSLRESFDQLWHEVDSSTAGEY